MMVPLKRNGRNLSVINANRAALRKGHVLEVAFHFSLVSDRRDCDSVRIVSLIGLSRSFQVVRSPYTRPTGGSFAFSAPGHLLRGRNRGACQVLAQIDKTGEVGRQERSRFE